MTGMSHPLPEFLDFRRPTRYISRKGDAFALAEGGCTTSGGCRFCNDRSEEPARPAEGGTHEVGGCLRIGSEGRNLRISRESYRNSEYEEEKT